VPGFSELTNSQRNAVIGMVTAALKGKNPTAALIAQAKNLALSEVTKNTKASGW
jgi:hypothetical protein